MTESRQKWFALLASVGLTALLVGVFVGAWGSWRTSQDRWEDADLLQQQLERVTSQNDTTPSGPEPALIRVTVAESQARLAEAQAALEEESERISRSLILAPFDGTVVEKHAEMGGHLSPGAPIVDIVSRGQIDARLMVPETVINEVYLDQPLTIVIDPLGQQAQGTVVSVTPYGPAASRTFPVRVRLDDQDGRLKVGMSVTVRITMGPPREALVVPSDAVLIRPDEATVWVTLPSRESEPLVEPVPVTITARMRDEYAVEPETDRGRQILIEGTQVVIEGAERLTPGQPVRIIDETLSQRMLRWRHPDGAAPTRRSFS